MGRASRALIVLLFEQIPVGCARRNRRVDIFVYGAAIWPALAWERLRHRGEGAIGVLAPA